MNSRQRYMLDTDTCIYIINRQPPQVIRKCLQFQPHEIGISAITGAELHFGVAKSGLARNRQALEMFLSPFSILAFGHDAMSEYGSLRAHLQVKGTPIGPLDTLIAAHALSCNAVLVTNNVREFSRVPGLKLENWVG